MVGVVVFVFGVVVVVGGVVVDVVLYSAEDKD